MTNFVNVLAMGKCKIKWVGKLRKANVLVFFLLLMLTSPFLNGAHAGMQESLEGAFRAMGLSNNVTSGGGYQDQTGGFYTGGSLFARGKAHNAELFSLQMPHYRAGCGGIDLFMGGVSFINEAGFTQLLRNIGSNASGYAFNLALATVTPQIKSVLDDLAAKVQKMTNQSINSCEAAATLVGGVWPQSDASSQILCKAMSKDLKIASDWAQSHQRCGPENQRETTTNQKTRHAPYKDVLAEEFNIAWKSLKKNAFLSADPRLAEFFMTISGTIVSRKTGAGNLEIKEFPSKSGDADLISALLTGGVPVQVYTCDDVSEDKCLHPALGAITLPPEKALAYRVERLLTSLSQHLATDTATTPEQQAFVNSTMIPVLKIMAVEMAFKEGASPLSMHTYKDAIAYDILLQYLDEVMSLVWDSATQLKQVQVSDKMIEAYRKGIASARKVLFAKRTALFHQISLTLDAIERTHQIERKLQNSFISGAQGAAQ